MCERNSFAFYSFGFSVFIKMVYLLFTMVSDRCRLVEMNQNVGTVLPIWFNASLSEGNKNKTLVVFSESEMIREIKWKINIANHG